MPVGSQGREVSYRTMWAFPVLFVMLIFAVTLIVGQAKKAEQSRKLSAFLRSLKGGRGQTEQGFFDSLASTWIKGTLRGRPITLDFERRGSGQHEYTVAQYGLEVDNAAGDVDLSKGNAFDWPGSLLSMLKRPEVLTHLGLLQLGREFALWRALLDDGFTVRLASGRLLVEKRIDVRSLDLVLDLVQLNAVYARLHEVADLCERREVRLKVEGRSATPRFVWTGGGQTSLCPFCRDQVRADDERDDDVTACDRCGTVHHRACFDEAGGCTIFGCGSGVERVAARA